MVVASAAMPRAPDALLQMVFAMRAGLARLVAIQKIAASLGSLDWKTERLGCLLLDITSMCWPTHTTAENICSAESARLCTQSCDAR